MENLENNQPRESHVKDVKNSLKAKLSENAEFSILKEGEDVTVRMKGHVLDWTSLILQTSERPETGNAIKSAVLLAAAFYMQETLGISLALKMKAFSLDIKGDD